MQCQTCCIGTRIVGPMFTVYWNYGARVTRIGIIPSTRSIIRNSGRLGATRRSWPRSRVKIPAEAGTSSAFRPARQLHNTHAAVYAALSVNYLHFSFTFGIVQNNKLKVVIHKAAAAYVSGTADCSHSAYLISLRRQMVHIKSIAVRK